MPLAPGARLGPYEVLSRVGAGGMGEVYRARHTRLERDVAVKALPDHLASDEEALARFEREAQAVAALSHPHILAIHDFCVEAGVAFAVMELLDGQTLRERIAAGRLHWTKAAEIGVAIAEGLDAAHAKGIVHRDVKPENVFLTADGGVKILDFGLARLAGPGAIPAASESTTLAHTKPGTVLGTLGYMSPEQTRGEAAGPPSDIFSLGCVLHEMLTGERAFVRKSAAETMAATLHEEPAPPSTTDGSIPAALDVLVRQCLEKAPGRRFHSALDLAFALRAVLSGSHAWDGRSRAASEPRDGSRGRWRVLTLVALGAFVAGAAGLWLWRSERRPGPASEATPTPVVAVLPFEGLGTAEPEAYFGDGVAEAVTTDLASIPGLRVINRTSAFRYRGRDADVRKAGAELNARYLVQGTVQRSAERLRLHARLVDATTGYELWAERYDRELKDVFAVQDDIARAVVQAIGLRLAPTAPAASRRPPPGFEAYDAYLRGRAALARRTPESLAQAVTLFEKAIAREPEYAEAYAGLADTFLTQARGRNTPYAEGIARASGAAERALALDPDLAEGHTSRGGLHLERLEWQDCEREYRRAIEIKPAYATAHQWYAMLLYQLGRLDEGLSEATRATELDPLSVSIQGTLAIGLYLRGDLDLAFARAQRAMALSPDFPGPIRMLSQIEASRGRLPQAFEFARRAAEKARRPVPLANLARLHARLGRTAEARAILDELEREPEPCVACVVDVQLALGDLDRALASVRRGGWTPAGGSYFPQVDPAYDGLRSDPRFAELLGLLRLQ